MAESKRKILFSPRYFPNDGGSKKKGWRAVRWSAWLRYTLLILSTVFIALMFPRSSSLEYQHDVGSIWSGDTLRAPFDFPIYKDQATYKQDLENARADVLPVFVTTGITARSLKDTIARRLENLAYIEEQPGFISPKTWEFIRSIPEERRPQKLAEISSVLQGSISLPYTSGVIDRNKSSLSKDRIAIRHSEAYEEERLLNTVYDSLGVLHSVEASVSRNLDQQESVLAMTIFHRSFTPMYRYSEALTEESLVNAEMSVPKTKGTVSAGERIIATGARISEDTRAKLTSFERSMQMRQDDKTPYLEMLGNFGHILILIGLMTLYLYHFRRRIFYDNLQLGIILVTTILVSIMAYISLELDSSNLPIEYLILIPFVSMLLAILYDSRTAFYITVTGCLIIAGIRGSDYTIAIACLSAGVLAAYTVRDIKSRTQLFRSIAYSMLGFSLAVIALGLERGESLDEMGLKLAFSGVNAIISPVLTFGAILLIESLFNVATDLKLLEYDTLNHPLMKMLADKAPGTYQHTLTIARLAESAANAVGANALLAKVGSYYHDIGKILKPEYFVENQMEMGNKHDKIKADKSAKIIREHVLDGMEVAQQYKLPQRIIDFIPMHHGTTFIQYFLDKARETDPDVEEKNYRYPGPLPHSPETAIVMLADAVEATTRSLPDPTPKAIETTIDRIIKKRFTEGQLDQCELTLADLTTIKTAFIKNLIGMSHPRIQYKSGDDQPSVTGSIEDGAKEQGPVIPYIDDAFGGRTPEEYREAQKKKKADESGGKGDA